MFGDGRPASVWWGRYDRAELGCAECARRVSEAGVLKEVVAEAASEIPGAQCAGLTLISHGRSITTLTSTDHYPVLLDGIQQRHLEGPCLTAAWLQDTVRIDDLAFDGRWPDYQRDALLKTPIRSVLSFRLATPRDMLGVLSVYSNGANAFDDRSEDIGLKFAAEAARGWDGEHRHGQLRSALAGGDVVEQAQTILMEQFDINTDNAFELLQRLSCETDMLLAGVARRIAQRWFDAIAE